MSSTGGPCGACKFLRRKCVAGCIFAPYFDSEEGTEYFAAVHKIFGNNNISKLLSKIPANRRFDAVATLRYEALARIDDPVYGCVAHLIALQNQVMNLEAELSMLQNHVTILQRLLPPNLHIEEASSSNARLVASVDNSNNNVSSSLLRDHCTMPKQQQQQQQQQRREEDMNFTTLLGLEDVDEDGDDLGALANEFVSKYLTGDTSQPPSPI